MKVAMDPRKRFKLLSVHFHPGARVTVTVQLSCDFYDCHAWRFYIDSHVATLNTAEDLTELSKAAFTETC